MASLSSVSSCSKIESVKNWLYSFNGCDFEQDDESTEISSPFQGSYDDQSLSGQDPMSAPKYRQKSYTNNNIDRQAGQEIGKKNSQDKNKPFYVPRKPHFFEHDLRNWDEDEEGEGHKKRGTWKKDDSDSWAHDKYNPDLQKPKSKQEIIESYGYDIRYEKYNECNPQSKRHNRIQKKMGHRQNNSPVQECQLESVPEPRINTARKTITSQKNCTKVPPLNPNHEYRSDLKSKQIIFNQPRSNDRHARFNNTSLSNSENKCSNAPDLEVISTHERKRVDKSVIPSLKVTSNIKTKPSNNYNPKFSGNHDKPKLTSLSRVGKNLPTESSVIRDATEIPKQSTGRQRSNAFNRDITSEKNNCSIKSQSIISSKPKVANSSKKVGDIVQNFDRKESSSSEKNKRSVGFTQSSLNGDYSGLDPLARLREHRYYNTANGCDENEDFIFPRPPDVSAAHLSPYIPQNHYFFTNNHPHLYYQQGYEPLPMQWGYYTQSNCYQGNSSAITILKQHCVGNWNDPSQVNQLVIPSQHMDSNSYFTAPEEVETSNESREIEYITSSITRLSTSSLSTPSIPQTTHRYSLLRSKYLNQLK